MGRDPLPGNGSSHLQPLPHPEKVLPVVAGRNLLFKFCIAPQYYLMADPLFTIHSEPLPLPQSYKGSEGLHLLQAEPIDQGELPFGDYCPKTLPVLQQTGYLEWCK